LTEAGIHQFWDTSAVVALVSGDPFQVEALQARKTAEHYWAWDWLQMEAESALHRRRADECAFQDLGILLDNFRFLSLSRADFPELRKIFGKYRLRSADVGNLLCLQRIAKITPDIHFVCFDVELNRAARKEGIPVFGRP
jgi:hypothetical protein